MPAARPDVATESYDAKEVKKWLDLVREAHVAYLTQPSPDGWVKTFLGHARNRLLDLELGYDSATSREWRLFRVLHLKHLGYDTEKDGPIVEAGQAGSSGGGGGGVAPMQTGGDDDDDDDEDYDGGSGGKGPAVSQSNALNQLLASAGVSPSAPPKSTQKQGVPKRTALLKSLKEKIQESKYLLQTGLDKGMDITDEPDDPMVRLQRALNVALDTVATQPSAKQEASALSELRKAYDELDDQLEIKGIKISLRSETAKKAGK